MNVVGQAFVYYLALMFLVYCTHVIVIGVLGLFLTLPEWSGSLSFYVIAAIYTYLIIRYRIRVQITMHRKTIFDYENRKEL